MPISATGTNHNGKPERATKPWSSSGFISAGNIGSVDAATTIAASATAKPIRYGCV